LYVPRGGRGGSAGDGGPVAGCRLRGAGRRVQGQARRAARLHRGRPPLTGPCYVGVRTKSETPTPPKTIVAAHAATMGGSSSTRPSDRAPELTTQYATPITTAIAPPMRRPPRGHRAEHTMARTASTRLISGNESLEGRKSTPAPTAC